MKVLFCLCLLLWSGAARADEITVAGAASLREALTAIARSYQSAHPQTRVNLTFGASGTLQKQIEQGAPIDVFVAASDKNMNALLGRKLADVHARFNLASGEMVLIAPRTSPLRSLSDLRASSVRNIAIGGPGVPAGDYARQVLKWYRLDDVAPKLVYAKDVRAVLTLVSSGNAEAGWVYRTDARSSPDVKIVSGVWPRSHAPIRYPMALLSRAPNAASGREWVRFCKGKTARAILKKYGFVVG